MKKNITKLNTHCIKKSIFSLKYIKLANYPLIDS